MPKYIYSQLSQSTGSIRLLRLLPRERGSQILRCEVFEYDLRNSPPPYHPYEALSYVWGGENKPCSIILNDQSLNITQNLYAILLRLRAHNWSRVLWADAVCINQDDEREKEKQIPLIAEIFAKAQRVIIWLGESGVDGEQALKAISLAGKPFGRHLSHVESFQPQILTLLRRPWFQRIWVLQEVAAARHISVMCGSAEIDGHAFSLGIESLYTVLDRPVTQIALIREAIYRPRNVLPDGGRSSLDICSLGELVDMYHKHRATRLHDKVYALYGMCSEDLTASELEPNYNLECEKLMRQLVRFILGDQVVVNTWNDKQIAVIESKGDILGRVSRVQTGVELGGKQSVEIIPPLMNNDYIDSNAGQADQWILWKSAISIQQGDLICHLHGAPGPSIIRFYNNHFMIIMIAALPPKRPGMVDGIDQWPKRLQSRELSLVWNWEFSEEQAQDLEELSNPLHISNLKLSEMELIGKLRYLIRIWDAAHILEDVGEHGSARVVFKEAVNSFRTVFGDEQQQVLETQHVVTLLSWAALEGYEAIVKLLLETGEVDIASKDKKYGRTPLSWAAENGHEAVIKLLIETGEAEVDSKDTYGRTPLSWAAEKGHEAVVKLLLDTRKVDIDSRDDYGRAPLSWAAENGYEAVVKLLLEAGDVDIDSKDKRYGRTPLSWAAENGHEAIIELLLETEVHINSKDKHYRTPLSRAAENGHEAVIKLLLETGEANIDSKDNEDCTPLSWAAMNGHEAAVKLLLETWVFNIDSKDKRYGRTPLSWAAENGHEAVVKLLLATRKVDIDSRDDYGRAPLSWAAENGHEAVFKLLLETGGVNINSEDKRYGRTPLSWAAENGHEAIVKLLLEMVEVNIDSKSNKGRTPLSWAAERGQEAVVKLLLETRKVDINSRDDYGRAPLSWAAINGHTAVGRLLLEVGEANIDSKDNGGRTPLSLAANNGHEAFVKLLLETGEVDIASKDKRYGRTPLSRAAENGHEAVVKLLLKTGEANIDSKDNEDCTPLSWASENGHAAIVKLLLEAGDVDIDSKDKRYGRTPLSWAAKNDHEAIVKLLLDTSEVDIDSKDNEDCTPLSWAAESGHETVVKLLLETGEADIDSKDNGGRTPLSWAAKYGHEAVVKLLLETGEADIDSKDNEDYTPLSLAAENGHAGVVKLLQSYQ